MVISKRIIVFFLILGLLSRRWRRRRRCRPGRLRGRHPLAWLCHGGRSRGRGSLGRSCDVQFGEVGRLRGRGGVAAGHGLFALQCNHCGGCVSWSCACIAGMGHTSVKVGLLGEFVIGITIGVDRSVELLKGHECMHKLIVGMEQASKPLLVLDMMDLLSVRYIVRRNSTRGDARIVTLFAGEVYKLRIAPSQPGCRKFVPSRG